MVSLREVKDTGIIDELYIFELLERAKTTPKEQILDVIEKAKSCDGLSLDDLAILIQNDTPEVTEAILHAARVIRKQIYNSNMVFSAPLYVSNTCVNNCPYCNFRKDNEELVRHVMDKEEIRQEVKTLLDQGYRHITLIAAEHHSLNGIDYIEQAIKTIYETHSGDAFIQRVDVNCAPLSIEEYHRLKECKIGTYEVFQETYHQETYRRLHPTGPKSFFGWRINAIGRAIDAGIDDIAIGPLLGLFDWKFEVMATLMHALHLNEKYAIRPHSVSIQRLKPVPNAPMSIDPSFEVTDDDLKLIIAILRLAMPQTGIILSTNEAAELRDELISVGVTQSIK